MKLGLGLWALICMGLLNRGVGPKAMVPVIPQTFFLMIFFHGI